MADSITELLEDLAPAASNAVAATPVRDRLRRAEASVALRESWKYTRLARFLDPISAATVCEPVIDGLETPGVRTSRLSRQEAGTEHLGDSATAQRFPLADLALLLTGDCLIIELDADTRARLSIDFGNGISVPVLIRIGSNAELELVESCSAPAFANHCLYIELGDGARLAHARSAFDTEACHWSFTQVTLARTSHYSLEQYLGGGRQRRHEVQIILDGPESSAELTGAYRVLEATHLDQQITVEHRAGRTQSQQKFHGLGAGKGTAVFNGRIHIHPGAPGSNARLSNRNLALHPDAVINTKPELEIYTDDVKCAHGATVGQLSAESLFYLRARGVTEADARRLLCRAFIRECIKGPLTAAASLGLLDEDADSMETPDP